MPAYYRAGLADFIAEEPQSVIGQLQIKYAEDGFAQQYLTQTRAWAEIVPALQAEVRTLLNVCPALVLGLFFPSAPERVLAQFGQLHLRTLSVDCAHSRVDCCSHIRIRTTEARRKLGKKISFTFAG